MKTFLGWTEKDTTKRDLESIVLEKGAATEALKFIEQEIVRNYELKDWSKFDYIQIEPPAWSFWTFGILMILIQSGFWIWAWNNEFAKKRENAYGR